MSGNNNHDALPAAQVVAESLRRSAARNNTVTPTRTVRLTVLEEQQQQRSRDTTPLAMAEGILVRSSVTRRSPRQQRRFESPLENAPIRGVVDTSPQRITIRPGAGNIVGDVLARNHGGGNHGEGNEDPVVDQSSSSKNAKLAHSHRKIRRWNNDRLVDLDISSAKVRQLFADAKDDAHHYKAIVNPLMEQKNTCYQRFLTEPSLQIKRDAFFSGEGPSVSEQRRNVTVTKTQPSLARLHAGLRRMVERAHRNSLAATKVLTVFEAYVVQEYYNEEEPSHGSSSNSPMEGWWKDLLLEAPHITVLPNGKKQVEFRFDPVSHSGGFHRLLLSAVAQFHGIKAKGKNRIATRTLILEGSVRQQQQQQAPVVRLLAALENKEAAGSSGVPEPKAPGTIDTDDFTLVDPDDDGGGSSTTYVLVSDDDDGSYQDAIVSNSTT